jgi:hypothetical protein
VVNHLTRQIKKDAEKHRAFVCGVIYTNQNLEFYMDSEKYDRSIVLNCPTCGNTDFETSEDDNNPLVKCVSCNREITKDDLINENGENIDFNVEEVADEVLSDLSKMFKSAFKGSKNIKIK